LLVTVPLALALLKVYYAEFRSNLHYFCACARVRACVYIFQLNDFMFVVMLQFAF